ncbi:SIR2 family NAD-dependent protein deacylase [Mycoplasma phocoenae]|uniref:NAD-dependent deacetylase n=1 Tax=Mycoplasma phocoenae TaxID=754517 RepID=A0A858U6H3_9MOLU|nr:NAD-dependent deacetylase [Mycoplasma phocoenae]QJG67057.1 NAD-dependent deacetylase [Mycoplasma phocoenae]
MWAKQLNKNPTPKELNQWINEADAIVVGIGAGMTSADGIGYSGKRFESNFPDFIKEYRFLDMLQASLYHFPSWQTYWAFQSRFMDLNYFSQPAGESFINLLEILKGKEYFIITTNSDSSLEVAGFDQQKVFYIQGKYNLLQCSAMCHQQRYQMDDLIKEMISKQENMQVPYELLPHCPKCDAFLEVNKRVAYKGMAEDDQFFAEKARYDEFIKKSSNKKVLFWELGVGYTTPQLIKIPFWEMTKSNKNALYIAMNAKNYRVDKEILDRTIAINDDINAFMKQLKKEI